MKYKVNFFYVGKPKTGSTALYYYLKDHSQIFLPEKKEPNFFCSDFHKESDNFHNKKMFYKIRNIEDYHKLYTNSNKEKILGDFSVNYIYSKNSAKEIYKYNPNSKILILFREPVSFINSFHSQHYNSGYENEKIFFKAIKLEKERKKGREIPKTEKVPSHLFYSERVKYSEQLKRFLRYFPKRNIKVIIYEDFKKNNLLYIKEICDFLKINIILDKKPKKYNTRKFLRFRKVKLFLENPLIWKIPKKFLSEKIYSKLKEIYYQVIFSKKNRKLDSKLKKQLMKKYKPEVVKLNDLLHDYDLIEEGRDLVEFWGYDKV